MYFQSVIIEHHGYKDRAVSVEKMRRNKDLIEADLPKYVDDPSFVSTYADALCKLGDYNAAIAAYTSVIEIKNAFEIHSEIVRYAMTGIVFCLMQIKDYNKALERALYFQLIEMNYSPHLTFMIAELYYIKKEFAEAHRYYSKVTRLDEYINTTPVNYAELKSNSAHRLTEIENRSYAYKTQ